MIETVSRYPRRQWPVCPNCGSRETVKTEKSEITVFQCEACQYQWPRVQPPPERLGSWARQQASPFGFIATHRYAFTSSGERYVCYRDASLPQLRAHRLPLL